MLIRVENNEVQSSERQSLLKECKYTTINLDNKFEPTTSIDQELTIPKGSRKENTQQKDNTVRVFVDVTQDTTQSHNITDTKTDINNDQTNRDQEATSPP